MPEITLDVYKAMVGQEVGVSRSFEVAQDRIDTFADVTEDHQFIHAGDKPALMADLARPHPFRLIAVRHAC